MLQIRATAIFLTCCIVAPATGDERIERFDKDPNWDGHNNRSATPEMRTLRQDFGYGGGRGNVGGFITPAAESAYYGRKIEPKTIDDPLAASGKLIVKGRELHALIGFFKSGTANEWRTPNTIAIRLLGRGDRFLAFVEYTTAKWRAGGDSPGGFAESKDPKTGRGELRGFKTDTVHEWSIKYDPTGHGGAGSVTVTLGGEMATCHLDAGHKADGATFDRFGLMPVLKSADGGGEIWLDDVAVGGAVDDFAKDPGWEGVGNRRTYRTADVRPRFDFGFSPTRHASGSAIGELGGLIFRGDCRYRDKLAAYGDRLAPLNLDLPLKASGKIALRRGVSDSTTLIGFYHSEDSLRVNPSQKSGFPSCFLGAAVEGPSREGFLFYPAYRVRGDGQGYASGNDRPHILPDGKSHDWSLDYDPKANAGRGRIAVRFDAKTLSLDLGANDRATGARFDRFGLVTTWIDGNAQRVYFDDLTYTCR